MGGGIFLGLIQSYLFTSLKLAIVAPEVQGPSAFIPVGIFPR